MIEYKRLYHIPDEVIQVLFENNNLQPDVFELHQAFKKLDIDKSRWFDERSEFRKYNFSVETLYQYDIDYFICKYLYGHEAWIDLFSNTKYSKEIQMITRLKTLHNKMCYAHFDSVSDEKDFCLKVQIKGQSRNVTWGKFLRTLPWLYDKNDADYEAMVNIAKSKLIKTFKIREVQGTEIIDWYYSGRYAEYNTATLGQSCMRYSSCQDYLHIYNQDGIRMIIVIDNDEKLVGRAILWDKKIWNKNYFDDTVAFIDRIYGTDSTIQLVKEYCKTKHYAWKERQSYDCPKTFQYLRDGEIRTIDRNLRVNIDTSFDYYPFMDTMYMMNDGYLANQGSGDRLRETDGYTRSNECCYDCGDEVDDHSSHSVDGDTYCGDCARYSEYSDCSYRADDVVWSDRDNDYYYHDDAIYVEYHSDYIFHEDVCQDFNDNHCITEESVNIHVDDTLIFSADEFKHYIIRANDIEICIPHIDGTLINNFMQNLYEHLDSSTSINTIEFETEDNETFRIDADVCDYDMFNRIMNLKLNIIIND